MGRAGATRPQHKTCDHTKRPQRQDAKMQRAHSVILALLLLLCLQAQTQAQAQQQQQQQQQPFKQDEYQLVAALGDASVELPCLIGLPEFCGEPYLITWHKLNRTHSSWTRLEVAAADDEDNAIGRSRFSLSPATRPHACEWPMRPAGGQTMQRAHSAEFKCAALHLRAVQLDDEARYKCETTFMDATYDSVKCPAATHSQLSVVAHPREPELLVNGRHAHQYTQLREADQVRLECASAGGKPAPRIEWLNVSLAGAATKPIDIVDVRAMRTHWPLKLASIAAGELPVTTAAVSFTVSRYDLRSRFVCAVLPAPLPQMGLAAASAQLTRQDALLVQRSYLSSALSAAAATNVPHTSDAPMLKWTQLDIAVRPIGVRVQVRDAARPHLLIEQQQQQQDAPYFSLEPNRAYAIQCLVDASRPRSQVAWFNRTAEIAVEQLALAPTQIAEFEQLRAAANRRARLTSFVRYEPHDNGTFSTIATLLLTTSVWDNLEEFYCRVSNEAFTFDELAQVAPIISARLYINYAPLAWIDIDTPSGPRTAPALSLHAGARARLRCALAANPFNQNALVQFHWLKDGVRVNDTTGNGLSAPAGQQFVVETSNQLHIAQPTGQQRLAMFSTLTIAHAKRRAHTGTYTCHFRLIPTPTATSAAAGATMAQQQQQHQQLYSGITSGKANASVQIDVLPSGDGDDEYDYGDARVDSANVDVNAASTLARKREEGQLSQPRQSYQSTTTTTTETVLVVHTTTDKQVEQSGSGRAARGDLADSLLAQLTQSTAATTTTPTTTSTRGFGGKVGELSAAIACALVSLCLTAWLGMCVIRRVAPLRHLTAATKGTHKQQQQLPPMCANNPTSWRFASVGRSVSSTLADAHKAPHYGNTMAAMSMAGLPAANHQNTHQLLYGCSSSTSDTTRDMMLHSAGSSSAGHYCGGGGGIGQEELIRQEPIYFNKQPPPPLPPSVPPPAQHQQQQQQQRRLAASTMMRQIEPTMLCGNGSRIATSNTMALTKNKRPNSNYDNNNNYFVAPLVDGNMLNSRIDLSAQQQQPVRPQQQQQRRSQYEQQHIYDDVIYNQMIL